MQYKFTGTYYSCGGIQKEESHIPSISSISHGTELQREGGKWIQLSLQPSFSQHISSTTELSRFSLKLGEIMAEKSMKDC